jgi:RimJ/RimL family protein N-acetyltransferase
MEPVEIRTERLLLRPFALTDVPALVAAISDPEVPRWTRLPTPYTEQDGIEWAGTVAAGAWESGTGAPLAMQELATGLLVGSCGLHDITGGAAEIGYWCAAEARGRGLTTEAVAAVTQWGFDVLGLARIAWYAAVGNWASRRIAERTGYTIEEGVLPGGMEQRGVRIDCWVGRRLASDPPVR